MNCLHRVKGSLNSKHRFYIAATERHFKQNFVSPPEMFWNACFCISPGVGKEGTGDTSFPKDLSLGQKCDMLGTCQKLAFGKSLTPAPSNLFWGKNKTKMFCLSEKYWLNSFFLLHRNGWKKRNTGLLSSLEKIMILGSFLATTQRSPVTWQIRWVYCPAPQMG